MPTPVEILEAIAPEVAALDPVILDVHIDLAETQTGTVYGDSRNYAVALLAAHSATMANRGGASGAITSETEGQLSRAYGARADASDLAATGYGAELERLRRQYIFSARTVLV